MQEAVSGLELLLGDKADIVGKAKIAVFGLGSAGCACAEALARCGAGSLILADSGKIEGEDLENHLFAFKTTVGQSRVTAAKERIHAIDEQILVHTYETSITEDTVFLFNFGSYDFVVDALEDVKQKVILIRILKEKGIPFVTCMDMSSRLDPSRLTAGDIFRISGDSLARSVRAELKKTGIQNVRAVYSKEKAKRRQARAVFVPVCAGMMLAPGSGGVHES